MEAGSHGELLAAGGRYAELRARQQAHVDEVYDSGSEDVAEAGATATDAADAASPGTQPAGAPRLGLNGKGGGGGGGMPSS